MRTLQLSELVAYLPYGITFLHFDDEREIKSVCEFAEITHEEITIINSDHQYTLRIDEVMPILRPLSGLTNEMAIKSGYKNANTLRLMIISKRIPYLGMVNLLSHHYDVFGLIEAGLAIDINTIQK